MAKVGRNAITTQLTGRLGDVIFRRHYAETVAQLRAKQRKRKPSAAQKERQLRFREAQSYAQKVLADPLQRKIYQQLGAARGQPPNAVLISNFLTPPTVDLIEASGYHGQRDAVIKVLASDDVEVVGVSISIRDRQDQLIETGPARKDHGVWFYTTTVDAPADAAWLIEATAIDRPGHKATANIRV